MISAGDFLAISAWIFEIGFFVSLCVNIKYSSGKKREKVDEGS